MYNSQTKEYRKIYREKNRDKINQQKLKSYYKHKEECNKKSHEYRKSNKDKCEELNRQWRLANTEYIKEYSKEYSIKNKDKISAYNKKTRLHQRVRFYGLTVEEYNIMYTSQNGNCVICGKHKKLEIEHNHQTGKVRGLVCHKCNVVIGMCEEDITILQNVIKYLS